MRVAIIYSGFLRTWGRVLKHNKKYLFSDNTDLFFYTYDTPTDVPIKGIIPIPTSDKWEEVFYGTDYYEFIKDKHALNKWYAPRERGGDHGNVLQQWHNNFIAFCTTPGDYDVYVRSRGDVMLHGRIDFGQYDYSEKVLYCTAAVDWGGLNDQFAFGNYEVMKWYYSLYIEYFKKYGYLIPYQPEHSLRDHIEDGGIRVVKIDVKHALER